VDRLATAASISGAGIVVARHVGVIRDSLNATAAADAFAAITGDLPIDRFCAVGKLNDGAMPGNASGARALTARGGAIFVGLTSYACVGGHIGSGVRSRIGN
jgi:hypothetical protein